MKDFILYVAAISITFLIVYVFIEIGTTLVETTKHLELVADRAELEKREKEFEQLRELVDEIYEAFERIENNEKDNEMVEI